MKLVSTVKLQKARARAESTKPYFEAMYTTVAAMLAKSGNIMNPYLQSGASQKKAIIVITSNRGLAGGYNANVCRLVMEDVYKRQGPGTVMFLRKRLLIRMRRRRMIRYTNQAVKEIVTCLLYTSKR